MLILSIKKNPFTAKNQKWRS